MIVTQKVIDEINSAISNKPPETGGIFGSENHNIIDKVVFDMPISDEITYCYYSPNIDFLNEQIASWQRKKVRFMGIFHTHFANVKTLSLADKEYIIQIMNNMPIAIKFLYFPIFILPARELIVYKAKRNKAGITILSDELRIV